MIVLSQRTITHARKEHTCGECLGTIGTGDSYERARVVDGGDAWTWKAHHLCHRVSNTIAREQELWHDEVPEDSEIRERLALIFEGLTRLAAGRSLTGDCSEDCLDGCAYPGSFSECGA